MSQPLGWWAFFNEVPFDFSASREADDNLFIESFKGKERQDCLNEDSFIRIAGAPEKLAEWEKNYIGNCSHSTLANAVLRSSPHSSRKKKMTDWPDSCIPIGAETQAIAPAPEIALAAEWDSPAVYP